MKRHSIVILMLLLLCSMSSMAQKQRFFNLTVSDIKIDSVLPHFTYSIPIGKNYADSVYTLEIRYPEFLELNSSDIAKYKAITSATLPSLPKIDQQITVNRKVGNLEFSLVPLVERKGKKQFLVSFMIALTSKPKSSSRQQGMSRVASTRVVDKANRYAKSSILASGKWAKISVPVSGVYQLTSDLIHKAGFSDINKVKVYGYGGNLQPEQLTSDYIIQHDDLKEVSQCVVDGKHLFYAEGPVSWPSNSATIRVRNPYSSYGCYFLTEDNGSTPSILTQEDFISSFYPSANDYHSLHEKDEYAWFQGGRNLFESDPIKLNQTKKYTLKNDAKSTSGTLTVAITTGDYASSVSISCNGEALGTINLAPSDEYDKGHEVVKSYSVQGLQATNDVTITTTSGGPTRLDYISMAYTDVRPAPILTESFPVPDYVYNITNQNHHADAPVNMVIVIPTDQKLKAQADRLANFHRTHDGLSVRVVPADELYNEFSSGTPDAMAYRRYMKMLYDKAATDDEMPRSLLLFGDCVWDNRMLTSECKQLNPNAYLLAYESENSFSETNCYVNDGWFALLDDNEGVNVLTRDKEDVGVGRFPVVSEYDAKIMVDKTIAYAENRNAGNWENILFFMGDDGNDNLHMHDLNETAEETMNAYPNYLAKKVMWDAYTRQSSSIGNRYPEVRSLILQQQVQGALIMDYAGHGKQDQISHEAVLALSDFKSFSNTNLPLWITASCDIMPFDETVPTIGEASVLNPNGGSVAFWGTTRTVYAHYNKGINTAFLKHVLSYTNGKPTTLGEAQRLAKLELINTGSDLTPNKLQYALLGDPALALNLPKYTILVDSIDGKPLSSTSPIPLKGGAVVKVKGHIVNGSSDATNFNGLVTLTVRDTKELITCKKQDSETTSAFQFYDRPKTLYNGTDSVKNGEFTVTFALPRDLNYAEGTGLMNLFAVNSDHTLTANGKEERFTVNGSGTQYNDSIGPSIYCYLNTPSFVDGDKVNTTPFFVAQITDKNGLNTSGNGIGHDMQLIIDGDPSKTYNLNDNFKYDFGSYTKGQTSYSIPELSEGPHTLQFRAWDILNNSSTVTLHFNVVKNLAPDITGFSCTDNPARSQTTFIVTHNYIGSNVDVEVEVFDMSGKLLWRKQDSGVSSGNAFTTTWDLTTDTGAQLPTGVYLYRVKLSNGGASKVSKAKKLIVINNK